MSTNFAEGGVADSSRRFHAAWAASILPARDEYVGDELQAKRGNSPIASESDNSRLMLRGCEPWNLYPDAMFGSSDWRSGALVRLCCGCTAFVLRVITGLGFPAQV